MTMHRSLRERLESLSVHGEPVFEKSTDPALIAFGQLFVDSELFTFDANKHLRTGALTPIYDCWTESRRSADDAGDYFTAIWAPVWGRTDPVTGFRTGRDSAAYGSTPTVSMPQDERTAALLLLVTTPLVHLSASHAGSEVVVQAAADSDGTGFRFLTLAPGLVGPDPQPSAGTITTGLRTAPRAARPID
jgi:hypothetical protein